MRKSIVLLIFALVLLPKTILANEIGYQVEKVFKTINYYDATGKLSLSYTVESTKEEAENYIPSRGACSTPGYQDCYETTYKTIGLGTIKEGNKYCIQVGLYWKQVPLITKYDDIAIRWANSSSILTTISGLQEAKKNGNWVSQVYSSSNSLVQTFTYGAGITMNMYDNATNHIMFLNAELSGNPGTIYATYQHARHSNITQSAAMNYSISSSGLGQVLYFSNATTRGYYDGMAGVSVNTYPTGTCGS